MTMDTRMRALGGAAKGSYGAPARSPGRMPGEHEQKVAAVCAQVRELARREAAVHIDKGGVHHFVPLPGDGRFGGRAVDLADLNEVLEVDVDARTCTAEPGVTFAEVVRRTLAHGLLPKVVPELEGITVGGAVAGCSVESMSHRHGGFHDSCLEYEVVTGCGERRVLGRHDEPFHMMHGSYGTLAILTRVVFELVPAKPFVELSYRRHGDFDPFEFDMRERCTEWDFDFVDGIVHAPDELVLCLGRFVDSAPSTSSYTGAEIYYRSTRRLERDHLATYDYCFRYDTECHWLSRTVPPLEWKPVRRAVGRWFLGSTNLIRWSNRLGRPLSLLTRRPDVIVDVFIPARRFAEFWRWYERELDYWPLWIVPYRLAEPYPWIAPGHAARLDDDLMIDCAIYGKRNNDRAVDWSQVLEEKTYELGGIKTLISRNHYTRERFWEIYDRERWESAKRELDPDGLFRDLYEKLAA
jgi:FAD/FMN-containing dehydrogenase